MKHDELSHAEHVAFERLRETKPPASLETEILQTLKSEHLIEQTVARSPKFRNLYWLAAACAATLVGFFVGRNYPYPQTPSTRPMNQYAIFLHEDSTFSGIDIPVLIAEYSQWAEDLHEKGQLTAAEKLTDDVYHLGSPTSPQPSHPATGYFIIQAADLDEAKKIANSHPHLKYNGGIELRPIEKLD